MNKVVTKLQHTDSFEAAQYIAMALTAAFFATPNDPVTPSMSLCLFKNEDNTVTVETVVTMNKDTEEGQQLLDMFKKDAQAHADEGYTVTIEEDGETTIYSSLIAN